MGTCAPEICEALDRSIKDFVSDLGSDFRLEKVGLTSNPELTNRIGLIGFGGSQMKGMLVIQCSPLFLKKSHPSVAMGIPVLDADLDDWLGEIANQVLGRLKNLLLAFEVKLELSTPSVISGESLNIKNGQDNCTYTSQFLVAELPFSVRLHGSVVAPIDFSKKVEEKRVDEGDGMFF